ncbi:hypothetical protein [Myxosarcina sp. GI1]|uniref:DUF6887 family protein n=1 Tax=Myxosarcina sp. GI1 TaxID=1541065 RepID=UPI0035288676
MCARELRHYFHLHRNNNAAFQTYLAKRRKRSHSIITAIENPDFDDKTLILFLTLR